MVGLILKVFSVFGDRSRDNSFLFRMCPLQKWEINCERGVWKFQGVKINSLLKWELYKIENSFAIVGSGNTLKKF